MLEEGAANAFEDLVDDSIDDITDQLVEEGEVTYWTCSTDAERVQIETTVDRLRELSQQKIDEVNDLEEEIDEVAAEKRSFSQDQHERERVDQALSELGDEINGARSGSNHSRSAGRR